MASTATPPFDLARAHRWFAVESNNLAWDLVEAPARSADDVERMVHAAHAALFHWTRVGSAVNRLRGLCLLATAYAAAGRGAEAVRYADRCLAALADPAAAADRTAFEVATAHGCAAAAHAAAGDVERARAAYREALAAASTLGEADDRAAFDKLFPAPLAPAAH